MDPSKGPWPFLSRIFSASSRDRRAICLQDHNFLRRQFGVVGFITSAHFMSSRTSSRTSNVRAIRPHVVPGKATTGITGFDEITGGGLPRGRTTLLSGGPGSGKTIFALHFLVHGARELRRTMRLFLGSTSLSSLFGGKAHPIVVDGTSNSQPWYEK